MNLVISDFNSYVKYSLFAVSVVVCVSLFLKLRESIGERLPEERMQFRINPKIGSFSGRKVANIQHPFRGTDQSSSTVSHRFLGKIVHPGPRGFMLIRSRVKVCG